MSGLKTRENDSSVMDFLNSISDENERIDALSFLSVFKKATNTKPRMWGDKIVGFGKYHYKSSRSSQEGDWFKVGFSPRKNVFSLYLMSGINNHKELMKSLGKYKLSGSCLHIKKFSDIDEEVLSKIIRDSFLREVKYC